MASESASNGNGSIRKGNGHAGHSGHAGLLGLKGGLDGFDRPLSVLGSLEGKNLLLTGVTGFLGKVLLVMLLDRVPKIGRVTLLVRSNRKATALERVREILERSPTMRPLRERLGDGLGAFLEEKIVVADGDIREPDLGLGEARLDALCRETDAIVHVAGLTDFSPDPREAMAINVDGTRHVAEVARRCRGRALLHTSTAFVAGMVSGRVEEELTLHSSPNGSYFEVDTELRAIRALCERVDRDHLEGDGKKPNTQKPNTAAARQARIEAAEKRAQALGWPNVYTYSKGLAEHLLLELEEKARQEGRPALEMTMVRPSIVECARSFPLVGWNEGINTSGPIVWLATSAMRRLPVAADNHFCVVPVDDVAQGTIACLAALLAGRHRLVYQLASSDHNALTFCRAMDLTSLSVRAGEIQLPGSGLERVFLTHWDAIALGKPASEDALLPSARKIGQRLRKAFSSFDRGILPEALDRHIGESLEKGAKKASRRLLNVNRTLVQVEKMLKAYQPFVYDHDYVFSSTAVRELSAGLSEEERALFGFDLSELDWRNYWMKVQVPGLERWTMPLLRLERVAQEPAVPLPGMELSELTAPARVEPSRVELKTSEISRGEVVGGGVAARRRMAK